MIVADLAPYVRAPELMKEIARLVAKSGDLMGGLRNPAGLALWALTEKGRAIARMPVSPRLAATVLFAAEQGRGSEGAR